MTPPHGRRRRCGASARRRGAAQDAVNSWQRNAAPTSSRRSIYLRLILTPCSAPGCGVIVPISTVPLYETLMPYSIRVGLSCGRPVHSRAGPLLRHQRLDGPTAWAETRRHIRGEGSKGRGRTPGPHSPLPGSPWVRLERQRVPFSETVRTKVGAGIVRALASACSGIIRWHATGRASPPLAGQRMGGRHVDT